MKALVGAFNQEKALVGAFSVIVQLHRLIDLRHWSEVAVNSSLDIRVGPHQAAALARLLDKVGVQRRVMIPDLETLVAGARMGPGVGRRPVECSNSNINKCTLDCDLAPEHF